jgi:type VI secretion system protein ImpH
MAAASRGPGATVVEQLRSEPERFELLQAVRLLERAAIMAARDPRYALPGRLGFAHDPRTEVVSLRAALELAFPVAEIASLDDQPRKLELSVTMLGLNGVSGVLPGFYSQMLLDANRDKNHAPRDFFDILNHRAISLFLRAAQKYRLPLACELDQSIESNTFLAALLSLVGLGLPSLQHRQPVSDDALVYYGGHFSRNVATAGALQQILSEYFDRPVTVQQFQGRWVTWPEPEQTRLDSGPGVTAYAALGSAASSYATLGTDAVLGSHVWDVQGSFRVVLGPLNYEQFCGFLPDGQQMIQLSALARSYVGAVLSFDVQLILEGPEVPPLQLGAAPRLGWNTWLPTEGARDDANDAIFEASFTT